MLGVAPDLIARHGAVSPEVARAMADGALGATPAHIAVSVTGIAGPDGGSPEKPIGLVYLGVAAKGEATRTHECRFGDIGRCNVRLESVRAALRLVQDVVKTGLRHD
jgi:nicotinamide-nucleotide amidase